MMYSSKDHTFAICAYKECDFLEECVKSVIEQTERSNVFIATSTPNDFIAGIAAKYNIPVYVNDNGGEMYKDWNFAYSRAKTSLVTLMHQDDKADEDFVKYVIEAINSAKGPLISFTDHLEIREGAPVNSSMVKIKRLMLLPMRLPFASASRFIRRRVLSFGNPICCPSVTFVKDNLPGFKFKGGFKSNMDWQAWEELSRLKGNFVYCYHKLFFHRVHDDAATMQLIHAKTRRQEDYQMFCRFWPKPIAKFIMIFYSKSENLYTEE